MNDLQKRIDAFLANERFAVVGASTDRAKYGNKVLRAYQQAGRDVVAINPKADEVEGTPAFPDLRSLPEAVDAVSIVTPPAVTEKIIEQAAEQGIRHVWMQPGAESHRAVELAAEHGMNTIAGDACVLVTLGYREDDE
jgi:predicted CoA-binding protein